MKLLLTMFNLMRNNHHHLLLANFVNLSCIDLLSSFWFTQGHLLLYGLFLIVLDVLETLSS